MVETTTLASMELTTVTSSLDKNASVAVANMTEAVPGGLMTVTSHASTVPTRTSSFSSTTRTSAPNMTSTSTSHIQVTSSFTADTNATSAPANITQTSPFLADNGSSYDLTSTLNIMTTASHIPVTSSFTANISELDSTNASQTTLEPANTTLTSPPLLANYSSTYVTTALNATTTTSHITVTSSFLADNSSSTVSSREMTSASSPLMSNLTTISSVAVDVVTNASLPDERTSWMTSYWYTLETTSRPEVVNDSAGGGLQPGHIAAIVVCSLVVAAALAVAAVFFVRTRIKYVCSSAFKTFVYLRFL